MKAVMAAPALKRVGTLMGGTVLGQLAVFAVTPILTRLYAPEAFNDFGIYLAISGVFSVIATLRLEAAIPIARDNADAFNLTRVAFKTSCVIAILAIMLTFYVLSTGFLVVKSNPLIFSLLVGISVLLIGAFQAISALQVRHDGYSVIARAKAAQGGVLAFGQVAIGFLFSAPIALVMGDVCSRIAGLSSSLNLYRRETKVQSVQNNLVVLSNYLNFPKFSAPAALINSLGTQAPIFLLGIFFTPSSVGFYVFANRLIAIPVSLIATTLGQVFLGELGKALSSGSSIFTVVSRYFRISILLVICFSLVSIPLNTLLSPFILGDKWRASIPIINALLIMAIFQVPISTISQTLNSLGRNSWQLAWDIIRIVLVTAAISFSSIFSKNLNLVIYVYVTASIVAYIILLGLIYSSVKRHIVLDPSRSEASRK
ncbi:oligosaccharide flippase family protein [Deinococcus aerophilus]|uniref:oligosaccharide flippase family protein n=1 Tax=Deinococcus aerophilus TaxID=522488 RepID=UPI0016673B5D|nr:oligosaccharide flippase family protein [Deinococcus aerophilus]